MKSKRIQLGKPFGKQHLNQPLKIETWKPDRMTKKWTVGKLLNFRSFNFFMFPPDFLKMLQLNHLMLQLNHLIYGPFPFLVSQNGGKTMKNLPKNQENTRSTPGGLLVPASWPFSEASWKFFHIRVLQKGCHLNDKGGR